MGVFEKFSELQGFFKDVPCGTVSPPSDQKQIIRDFMKSQSRDFLSLETAVRAVDIPVYFIHLTNGIEGSVDQNTRDQQIDVLNTCFKDAGVKFHELGHTNLENKSYFHMGVQSKAERQCKKKFSHINPHTTLRLFTCEPRSKNLLGWATFPHELAADSEMDGIAIRYQTLPGGTRKKANQGKVAVHEVGHWLGLFHTFENGCKAPGDEVEDTPLHLSFNKGKPDPNLRHNLCASEPEGTKCPVHNYMNYTDDDWRTEFTPGQIQRIWNQIHLFRTDLINSSELLIALNSTQPHSTGV